jgi:MinD-like ATPase involved in chromosome partitioning or flagellar assembly
MGLSAEAPTRRAPRRTTDPDRVLPDRTAATQVRRGPLLAVCGLAGGAGTTTLTYLVAMAAARQLTQPVLAADTGGPTATLAYLAGVEAPRSLPALAAQLAAGGTLRGQLFAQGPHGVRLLASAPEFTPRYPKVQLNRVLDDAREAHCLTVLDCGTLARDVDRATAAATHVAWLMLATKDGVTRATRALGAAPNVAGTELLVARRDARQRKAAVRDLRSLAAQRGAPLVLIPHLAGLECRHLERAAQEAQAAIEAILGLLTR